MSWEGYYQLICNAGHSYSCDDVYSLDIPEMICPFCKSKPKWYNVVDQTNGSFAEDGKTRIDNYVKLKIKAVATTKKCECCQHVKVIEPETYSIPRKKGNIINSNPPILKNIAETNNTEYTDTGDVGYTG